MAHKAQILSQNKYNFIRDLQIENRDEHPLGPVLMPYEAAPVLGPYE